MIASYCLTLTQQAFDAVQPGAAEFTTTVDI